MLLLRQNSFCLPLIPMSFQESCFFPVTISTDFVSPEKPLFTSCSLVLLFNFPYNQLSYNLQVDFCGLTFVFEFNFSNSLLVHAWCCGGDWHMMHNAFVTTPNHAGLTQLELCSTSCGPAAFLHGKHPLLSTSQSVLNGIQSAIVISWHSCSCYVKNE